MSDQTLGEAIISANQARIDADLAFRAMLVEANARGASTRDMAKLLGWNHSTLWRWMDRAPAAKPVLDQPR